MITYHIKTREFMQVIATLEPLSWSVVGDFFILHKGEDRDMVLLLPSRDVVSIVVEDACVTAKMCN